MSNLAEKSLPSHHGCQVWNLFLAIFMPEMIGMIREWHFLVQRPHQNYTLATLKVFSCLIRNEQ
jgi:hypothetical protein